jgi:large subunit ribosomal protein L21
LNYAIIELGGRQYRVEKGDSVVVDRLDAKQGAKVTPRALLYRSGNKTVADGDELGKVKVEAVVAEHIKGEKLRVFKYRAKKRYRRRAGHRSLLTRLEIAEIHGPAERRKPPAAKAESKSTAAKKDEGSEPAEKQPAALRTTRKKEA